MEDLLWPHKGEDMLQNTTEPHWGGHLPKRDFGLRNGLGISY